MSDEDLAPPVDLRQSANALRIARGVRRHLARLGFFTVTELPLRSGRRADLVAVNLRGEIWIIEIKSSLADLRADSKWPEYRQHCDRLYFATLPDVGEQHFPEDAGLLLADGFDAAVVREAPDHPLAGATRKELLLRLARHAADRLHILQDPDIRLSGG